MSHLLNLKEEVMLSIDWKNWRWKEKNSMSITWTSTTEEFHRNIKEHSEEEPWDHPELFMMNSSIKNMKTLIKTQIQSDNKMFESFRTGCKKINLPTTKLDHGIHYKTTKTKNTCKEEFSQCGRYLCSLEQLLQRKFMIEK